jgi:hypothetical protein
VHCIVSFKAEKSIIYLAADIPDRARFAHTPHAWPAKPHAVSGNQLMGPMRDVDQGFKPNKVGTRIPKPIIGLSPSHLFYCYSEKRPI